MTSLDQIQYEHVRTHTQGEGEEERRKERENGLRDGGDASRILK